MLEQCISFQKDWQFNHQNPPGLSNPPGRRATPQFLSCWPVMPRPGGQACSTTIPVMLACRATTRRAGMQHHSSCHVGLSCHDQEGRRAAPQFLSCWPVMPRPGGQACRTTIWKFLYITKSQLNYHFQTDTPLRRSEEVYNNMIVLFSPESNCINTNYTSVYPFDLYRR